jgi:hypothetical protein
MICRQARGGHAQPSRAPEAREASDETHYHNHCDGHSEQLPSLSRLGFRQRTGTGGSTRNFDPLCTHLSTTPSSSRCRSSTTEDHCCRSGTACSGCLRTCRRCSSRSSASSACLRTSCRTHPRKPLCFRRSPAGSCSCSSCRARRSGRCGLSHKSRMPALGCRPARRNLPQRQPPTRVRTSR